VFWLHLRAHHCHPAPPNHRCAEPPSHRLTPPPFAGYYCICGKLLVLDMPNCIMDICLCDKYAMASMPRPPELPAPLLAMRARGQNQTIIHPATAVDDYFRFLRTRSRIAWDRGPEICTCKYFLLGEFRFL